MNIKREDMRGAGLSEMEIREFLENAVRGRQLKKVLIIPPDFTRCHSGAGFITNMYYHFLTEQDCQVDILIAQGTPSLRSPQVANPQCPQFIPCGCSCVPTSRIHSA